MAGSSKHIDPGVVRLASEFRRGWELRLGRYAKYNFDLSWPSISLLDLVLADVIGEQEPSKDHRELLLGAAAYIGVACANCWLRVGSGYTVSLELIERSEPEILLSAQVSGGTPESAKIKLASLVRQLAHSRPANPFPLYTGFKRTLPPRPYLFAMGTLGVALGLSPHIQGDWEGRDSQTHYNHVAAAVIELSRGSAEYYRQAFPSEPYGADAMLYRGGLIFPALFDGEDHYALRGALTIMEFASAKNLSNGDLQTLALNLSYSPDEAISGAGFAVAAALVEADIPDRIRWLAESLDIRRAMLKPTITILRNNLRRGGTPLDLIRRGESAAATSGLRRERELHLLSAVRPELLRPEFRDAFMVHDGALAEQLYWGNIVKAREVLQGLGEQLPAPLVLQGAFLDLHLGAQGRVESLLNAHKSRNKDPRLESAWHELEGRFLLERRDLLGAQRALQQAIDTVDAEDVTSRDQLVALRAETLLALDQPDESRLLLDSLLTGGKWSVRAAIDRVELDLTKQNDVDLQPDLELLVGRAPMLRRVMNVVLWYHSVGRASFRDPSVLLQ